MERRLKAAVCYEFGKPLIVEEVEIDDPGKDEVMVRLTATAICHSDIHCIRGDVPNILPLVAGHECSGYIEKVGENVTSVKTSDAVIASAIRSCGKCVMCRKGMPHLCEAQWPAESTRHLRTRKGQYLGCIINMSGFAEYMIVHESQVVKIPEGIKMDRAALLSCGVITGFGAVINRVDVKPLSSAVIIGAGGVGLNSIQGAVFSGATPVIYNSKYTLNPIFVTFRYLRRVGIVPFFNSLINIFSSNGVFKREGTDKWRPLLPGYAGQVFGIW